MSDRRNKEQIVAQQIREICRSLTHMAHDNGMYRLAFSLHNAGVEADCAIEDLVTFVRDVDAEQCNEPA